MNPSSPTPAAPADLWQHYGATSPAGTPRSVDARMYWDWYQRTGPGAEILGNVAGRTVTELGAGAGRQAAHVAGCTAATRVLAIDSSPTQHTKARTLYGHVPGVEFIEADAEDYLHRHPRSTDVIYSVFGAIDFTDPRTTLPAAAAALRPGGRLVFSTLAHYRNGSPPETDCRPADIPTPTRAGTMRRWVLDMHVWEKLLGESGFDNCRAEALPDPGDGTSPPMTTLVICASTSAEGG